MDFISDYKHNPVYRKSFSALAVTTFGIDFETWYAKGFWHDNYICYSYADGDKVAANISVNKMHLILDGKREEAIQIGTVMTHPDFQKRGLSRDLMEKVLADYEREYGLFYLLANKHVVDFYPRFGFKPREQHSFSYTFPERVSSHGSGRFLDIAGRDDLALIMNQSAGRTPISRVFGFEHAEYILMFHACHGFGDSLYYLERAKAIVIYQQEDETIHLYDVIAADTPCFADIIRMIKLNNARRAVFHFTPDLLNVQAESRLYETEDVLFIRTAGPFVKGEFKYPTIAEA